MRNIFLNDYNELDNLREFPEIEDKFMKWINPLIKANPRIQVEYGESSLTLYVTYFKHQIDVLGVKSLNFRYEYRLRELVCFEVSPEYDTKIF